MDDGDDDNDDDDGVCVFFFLSALDIHHLSIYWWVFHPQNHFCLVSPPMNFNILGVYTTGLFFRMLFLAIVSLSVLIWDFLRTKQYDMPINSFSFFLPTSIVHIAYTLILISSEKMKNDILMQFPVNCLDPSVSDEQLPSEGRSLHRNGKLKICPKKALYTHLITPKKSWNFFVGVCETLQIHWSVLEFTH